MKLKDAIINPEALKESNHLLFALLFESNSEPNLNKISNHVWQLELFFFCAILSPFAPDREKIVQAVRDNDQTSMTLYIP